MEHLVNGTFVKWRISHIFRRRRNCFLTFPKRHILKKMAHLVNGTFGKWHMYHIIGEGEIIFHMLLKCFFLHSRKRRIFLKGT